MLETVLLQGDLAKLDAKGRVSYMTLVCKALGLNPLTKPFEFINLNGKLTMYAKRECTEQLRKLHGVSLTIVGREVIEGVYIVTARAQDKTGRQDESTGAVPIDRVSGEARANAVMKAETKAKRRVTLSICGLGMLDESEVDSVPGATAYQPPPERGADPKAASPRAGSAEKQSAEGSATTTASKPPRANTIAHDGTFASHKQVGYLHTLRSKLGLDCKGGCAVAVEQYSKREKGLVPKTKYCTYHTQLAAFKDCDGKAILTSTQLSEAQISNLIGRYETKLAEQAKNPPDMDLSAVIPTTLEIADLRTKLIDQDFVEAQLCESLFGVDNIAALTKKQCETLLQLVMERAKGPDDFDFAVEKAIRAGMVQDPGEELAP